MSQLFSPLTVRGVTFPNRVVVSPLCMYSATDGLPQPWHFAHLSTFARGKAGLVFTEATAVEANGRITPKCLGIWTDEQAQALKPITAFIEEMGCVAGIQLAHAGRKASTAPPFEGAQPLSADNPERWDIVGPSAIPTADNFPVPHELTADEINELVQSFATAARRSLQAGFKVIEIHGAHGYLLHSFLSRVSNQRTDQYGGDINGRMQKSVKTLRCFLEFLQSTA
jgi:2,4-dienoyl-CoA reductase-like NADH-dependent reductase (Old Yellow Enzyme family)